MRTYWLDLFTVETWTEFIAAGGSVSGFRESRWKSVQQIKQGDYLLCYLTGISRWVGLLEVTDAPFRDETPIWNTDVFPCRLHVKIVVALDPATGVPVKELKDRLSYFIDSKTPNGWTGHFRGSPVREKPEDASKIVSAIREAKENPVVRPIDNQKTGKQPTVYPTQDGEVTIPEDKAEAAVKLPTEATMQNSVSTSHEEIQYLLLKLGSDLGMDLWVAKNDRNREFKGKPLGSFPKMRQEIPAQFDAATNKTIELIDVLWLKGNAIVAAFEVEHTTSIYSGLLRMSDLVSMQPNLKIKLYIVAPDSRREKVIEEINRPTFSKLKPPLNEYCQYISYSVLSERVKQIEISGFAKYLSPDFIDEIAETCATESL